MPTPFDQWLEDSELLGNSPLEWIVFLAIAIGAALLILLLRSFFVRRLGLIASRTSSPVDDALVAAIGATKGLLVFVVTTVLAGRNLALPGGTARWLDGALVIALALQAAIWGQRVSMHLIESYIERNREASPGATTAAQGVSVLLRLVVWSAALLVAIDNLGYDVTALIAGLGIGGVAIALAVQNVLGDLFASLSIILDKPFVVGDFVIVGDHLGTIEKVGLKTTRVRSLSGEQIIFGNSDLLSSRIRNYKRMQERRVAFSVGVTYQTEVAQLEAIPESVKKIIEEREGTRFDRAHFKGFGDSAYLFEIVYYVLSPDYVMFMDTQQAINLAICRDFEERGVDFAYPTRTLHIVEDSGAVASPVAE